MPVQIKLSTKADKYIKKLRIQKQFEKQKSLFIVNPFHPSLDFKRLKGANEGFYAFRINDQYRARLVKLDAQTYFILVVGDFH